MGLVSISIALVADSTGGAGLKGGSVASEADGGIGRSEGFGPTKSSEAATRANHTTAMLPREACQLAIELHFTGCPPYRSAESNAIFASNHVHVIHDSFCNHDPRTILVAQTPSVPGPLPPTKPGAGTLEAESLISLLSRFSPPCSVPATAAAGNCFSRRMCSLALASRTESRQLQTHPIRSKGRAQREPSESQGQVHGPQHLQATEPGTPCSTPHHIRRNRRSQSTCPYQGVRLPVYSAEWSKVSS